jgi:hypothetical protein
MIQTVGGYISHGMDTHKTKQALNIGVINIYGNQYIHPISLRINFFISLALIALETGEKKGKFF